MQLVRFSPLSGAVGIKVLSQLIGVPESATKSSLAVILSGSATLSLDEFTHSENQQSTLAVTIQEGSTCFHRKTELELSSSTSSTASVSGWPLAGVHLH